MDSKSDEKWEVISRELIFEAKPWLKLVKETVKLPDGRQVDDYYQIEQPDYVEIIAVRGDQKIRGLWHYKHGVKKLNLALPAGYIELTEAPSVAAKRELLEECGLESNHWQALGNFVLEANRSPAKVHLFLAKQCYESKRLATSDDLEPAQAVWLSLEEWLGHIEKGDVAVIGVVAAIALAKINKWME